MQLRRTRRDRAAGRSAARRPLTRASLAHGLTTGLLGGLLLGLLSALLATPARAEQIPQNPGGEIVFRGNYWRDRNTRVLNPTVDVRQELPGRVGVNAHYVLDAITSASLAAGANTDQPFTELRHEAGLGVDIPLPGKTTISASYSYSTESDYFSHNAGLRGKFNLFQDNTALVFGLDYGHNTVGKRLGPTGYLIQGVLQTVHLVALWSQVLGKRLLGTASYELTSASGYQNNVYRPVPGEQTLEIENLPTQRLRHVGSLSLHAMIPTRSTLVPHVTLRPGLRGHYDSWNLRAINPELAAYVPIGPVELRGLFSFYTQWDVYFYRHEGDDLANVFPGSPYYKSATIRELGYFTSDTKLGKYSTYSAELQLKWRLSFLRGSGPLSRRLSRTVIELTGGMWFADQAVGNQFGIPFTSDDPRGPAGCSLVCGAGFASLGLYIPL